MKKSIVPMFPYPSGTMHMGHVRNYAISDAFARYFHVKGYDVHQPIGFDAFGLPAENAAIQYGVHPNTWTQENMATMSADLRSLYNMFDKSSWISTCDPAYYTFEQEFFKEAYRQGYIFTKEEYVNYDPVDKTVLSNEQVINGKGWRSGAPVERRRIPMFFFDIRRYAKELHEGIDTLTEWPTSVKRMQREWIGYREGEVIPVTINDVSYEVFINNDSVNTMVFGVNTPFALAITTPDYEAWIQQQGSVSEKHHKGQTSWYVTGYSVMMEGRPIPIVIDPHGHDHTVTSDTVVEGQFQNVGAAQQKRMGVFVKLHQWCISRQRYWGNPIPMFECPQHGVVPSVGYRKVDIHRTEHDHDVPECGCTHAQPITDTMDTFVQSAWYYHYYRTRAQGGSYGITDSEHVIDMYIGGIEHATMHLIYTRFFHKMMRDMGYVTTSEPIVRLMTQGMVCKKYVNADGETVSAKMSKSIGNIVAPGPYISEYGSDAVKMAMIFAAPPDKNFDFEDSAIIGTSRFITQVKRYFNGDATAAQTYSVEECARAIETMKRHADKVFTSTQGNINTFVPQVMTSFKILSRTIFPDEKTQHDYNRQWAQYAWIVMPETMDGIIPS